MTNDEILQVAHEVFDYAFKPDAQGQRLITFARRIAAMQREIDAGICSNLWDMTGDACEVRIREQSDD